MNGLLQPWNLIFVLPFGCALLLLLLTGIGLIPDGHDSDVALSDGSVGDANLEMGHLETSEIPAAEASAIDGHATTSEVNHAAAPFWQGLLILIGFGRVPASLVLMCFGFFWGFIGWSSNQILGQWLPPIVFIWPSLLAATLVAGVLTRSVAVTVGRFLPSAESYGVSRYELAGKTATVRFRVTEKSGTAQLYDRHGNLHEVSCRIVPGGEELVSGEEILLISFEEDDGFYRVCRKPGELRVTDRTKEENARAENGSRPLLPSAETVKTKAEDDTIIEGEV